FNVTVDLSYTFTLPTRRSSDLEKLRNNFAQTYFVDGVIRCDAGDRPVDREKARDVIYYEWHDRELRLAEHETIRITDRDRAIRRDRKSTSLNSSHGSISYAVFC